jgi:hypothetical protein
VDRLALHRSLLIGVLLLAGGVLLAWPLLQHPGFLPWGSDVAFASQAAHGFAAGLREGMLYPTWVQDANLGLGGPIFAFYSPLAYAAVGLVGLGTGDIIEAMRIVLMGLGLLSGLSFYAAFRGCASRAATTLAALLYMLAPYHVLDLYWRFAFAEYAAFIWFPLLFLFLRRLLAAPDVFSLVGLAACYAALASTHLVSAYLAVFPLGIYAVVVIARTRRPGAALAAVAAGVLALCVASVYLLPMVAQRDQVHMDYIRDVSYADYRRNFLLRDEVALGYEPAPIKPYVNLAALSQGGLALAALALCGWRATRRKPGEADPLDADELHPLYGHAAAAVVCTVLQFAVSEPFWRWIPELATVQFPWRFASFQGLSACVLAAIALSGWEGRRARAIAWTTILLVAIPALHASYTSAGARPMKFDSAMAALPVLRTRLMFEYVPRHVPDPEVLRNLRPGQFPRVRLQNPGRIEEHLVENHRRVVRVATPTPNEIVFGTFHYTGWLGRLNEEPVELGRDPNGLVSMDLPAGEHEIELEYVTTPDRRRGALLSAAGASVMIVLLGWGFRQRSRRPPSQSR